MHKRGNLASSSGLFVYMSTPNIYIVFGLDARQGITESEVSLFGFGPVLLVLYSSSL